MVMSKRNKAFSLVELIAVMGVIVLLLALGTGLYRQTENATSRKAVRSLLLGGLNTARTRALATGESVAFVMTPYEQGRENHFGRGFSLFEVKQDEVTREFEAGTQLRRWSLFPGRFIFSKGTTMSSGGQNAFDQSGVLTVNVRDGNGGQTLRVEMPAIIFGPSGNVIWPTGGGELELQLTEGSVDSGIAVATRDGQDNWRLREVCIVGRQTGRARFIETR